MSGAHRAHGQGATTSKCAKHGKGSAMNLSEGMRVQATAPINQQGVCIARGARGRIAAVEFVPGLEGVEVEWDCGGRTWLADDEQTIEPVRVPTRAWDHLRNASWSCPRVMATALLAAFVGGYAMEDSITEMLTAEADTPLVVHQVRLLSAVVKRGEMLRVEYVETQKVECQGWVDRAWTSKAPAMLMHTRSAFAGAPTLGAFVVEVQVPATLAPGHYEYTSTFSVQCGDKHYLVQNPHLAFDLVE